MAIERIIGIDFGTSTSVVKVKTYKDGKPMDAVEMADFVRFNNKDTLPSLIYLTEQGDYLIGYDAENPSIPGTRYHNFKLDMIHPDFAIRGQALMLTKLFFNYLYETYEDQKTIFPACDIETTYVSYPAKWPEELCQTMLSIAADAGFKNTHGVDEPTAAIHAVLIQKGEALKAQKLVQYGVPTNVLMIDMGAGTTDLVLCKYTPGAENEVEFQGTWPKADSDVLFGGREIDIALCSYVKDYLTECKIPNLNHFDQNYLNACKSWKEANVSPLLRDSNTIRYCGFADAILSMFNIDAKFPVMNRSRFQELLSDYLKQLPSLINDCITEAEEISNGDIDLVILTGGHSQWYFVSEILAGQLTDFGTVDFPKLKNDPARIIKLSRPQETVALGLVYKKPVEEWVSITFVNGDPAKGTFYGTLEYKGIKGMTTIGVTEPGTTPDDGYRFAGWNDAIPQVYPNSNYIITGRWEDSPPPPPPAKKSHKKLFWIIPCALVFICLAILGIGSVLDSYNNPSQPPQQSVDFWMYNNTGKDISEVYIVYTSKGPNAWGNNKIEKDMLDGGKFSFTGNADAVDAKYNLKVVYESGGYSTFDDLELAKYANVYLSYNEDGTPHIRWDWKQDID